MYTPNVYYIYIYIYYTHIWILKTTIYHPTKWEKIVLHLCSAIFVDSYVFAQQDYLRALLRLEDQSAALVFCGETDGNQ